MSIPREATLMDRARKPVSALAVHAALLAYTALALFPIVLVIMNSFKSRRAIFGSPLALPTETTFSLIGYNKVFADSSVPLYFLTQAARLLSPVL